ncbi:MAG TPA: septum formation initiator family protein [Sphaerochaeta sp.]|jgi:cell division protein FtsB|nr:septum formation initiator family protein [Sphaerochaeta sp.]
MTRKILTIFGLTGAISYLILLSFAGKGGYLHNQALKEEIQRLAYADELLALEVDSLAAQRSQMQSPDAIKDAAFKYGYLEEGETVFYFDLPPEEVTIKPTRYTAQRPSFEGLATPYIVLLSLLNALIVTVAVVAMTRHRR